jgi:hypothetical protein
MFWTMVVFAMLRSGPYKLDLLAVTRAPEAKRKVNPQTNPLKSRQRAVKRVGLQARGLFAIW